MVPRVNWKAHDCDDLDTIVSADTILRDYRRKDQLVCPVVYKQWIPLWLLRDELWEEQHGLSYDWSAYDIHSIFPPIKLEIFTTTNSQVEIEPGTHLSVLYIRDGNHRIHFWRLHGFLVAPAWVLDYRQ